MPQWAVQAPDGKVIQFPDSFTEQDVNREMYKMYSTPPGVPRPQVDMQESVLPKMFLPQQNPQAPPPAKVPPSIQNAPDWVGEGIGGATLAGLLGMAPGVGRIATGAVKMAPYVAASEAINYARRELPGGKYIPAYAELLPWFVGGKGEATAEKPPKNADPFRDVPATRDVFDVKEPPPQTATMPRPAETPAPYRFGPGQIAPEEVGLTPNARVLAGGGGVITTPRGALPPAPYEELVKPMEAAPRFQNAPRTYSGESALRQILTGLGNKELLQIAKARGIDVAAESQLKPGVADARLIKKIIGDFDPGELQEIQARYLETNRLGKPAGISPEADNVATLQTYFPELKIPQTKLNRTRQSFAARPGGFTLYDLLQQGGGK